MTTQQQIYEAVKARGYTEGYSDNQLATRQIFKLLEEVAELGCMIGAVQHGDIARMMVDIRWGLSELGKAARGIFDSPSTSRKVALLDADGARRELADIYIVCCVLATALGVDLETIALQKATKDIERGVR